MNEKELIHRFDKSVERKYCIETGNFVGKCRDCGRELVAYTGSISVKIDGVTAYGIIGGDGIDIGRNSCTASIMSVYALGSMALHNTVIVRYKPCSTAFVEGIERWAKKFGYANVTPNVKHTPIDLAHLKMGSYYRVVRDYKGDLVLVEDNS